MPWFHYSQNNSGGSWQFDEAAGITHHVVIEASNGELADARAEQIGMYFDGCSDGRDCSCCGDRWPTAWREGDAEPMVYGEPVDASENLLCWMPEGKEIAVHPLDGSVRWYGSAHTGEG